MKNDSVSVSIVGLGYVGLSTAVCFADRGFRIYAVETDAAKCRAISSGVAPFREKGIDRLLGKALRTKRLVCTVDYDDAIQKSAFTFLTVGTPSRPDGSIDLEYVKSAAGSIGKVLKVKDRYHHVAVKSTVVPGTTQSVVKQALETSSGKACGRGFGLASNPEFLREGSAVEDTMNPDAIVIGTLDESSKKGLVALYRKFYGRSVPTIITTPSNAEFIKYAVNTFRATQLSFLNTLANLAEKIPGADAGGIIKGLSAITGLDKRYLRPGLGFGGSCLPKDLRALTAYSKQHGVDPDILEAAERVNQRQPEWAVRQADRLLVDMRGKRIAVLGLAFKANSDDIRESVAMKVVTALCESGANVSVFDPAAMANATKVLGGKVHYAKTALECIRGAECAVVATEWEEFKRIIPKTFVKLMKRPIVVDGKGALDTARMTDAGGLTYVRIGKGVDALPASSAYERRIHKNVL